METKHAIITAAAVIAAGIIGSVALHGLLNRYEIASSGAGTGWRLDKVNGETVYVGPASPNAYPPARLITADGTLYDGPLTNIPTKSED